MKFKQVIPCLFFLLAITPSLKACDICGCMPLSLGNMWTGMQNRHMVMLEGRWVGFKAFDGQNGSTDYLYQMSLTGRLAIGQRFRVSLNAPFSLLRRKLIDGEPLQFSGISDVSAMAEYALWRSKPDSIGEVHHMLWVGAGVKAPTGDFRSSRVSFSLPANFQLGTGSWDGLGTVSYQGNHDRWSWTLATAGRKSGINNQGFKLPSQIQTQGMIQRQFPVKTASWLTGVGAYSEWIGKTIHLETPMGDVGHGTFGIARLAYVKSSWSFAAITQIPIASNYANGNVDPKPRISMKLAFIL